MPTVWFVGAGPGDPDLITVRGRELIGQAGAILFAGSLVSADHLHYAASGCAIADSSGMTLAQMTSWLVDKAITTETLVRLQTGDPAIYGALAEMAQPLRRAGLMVRVVPGVPSAMASAAVALETLTLPEVTQTLIFTRAEGRTPMPPGERLADLARHGATLCIHLSITLLPEIRVALTEAGWSLQSPVLVVYKATWPGLQRIVRGVLGDIAEQCNQAGIRSQAMIIISPALGACWGEGTPRSKLYDPTFGHGFRSVQSEGGEG